MPNSEAVAQKWHEGSCRSAFGPLTFTPTFKRGFTESARGAFLLLQTCGKSIHW